MSISDKLKQQYKQELLKGTKEEHEHTNNDSVARRIALDHLEERKDYYTKLEQCMDKSASLASANLASALVEKEKALIKNEDKGLWNLAAKGSATNEKEELQKYFRYILDQKLKSNPVADTAEAAITQAKGILPYAIGIGGVKSLIVGNPGPLIFGSTVVPAVKGAYGAVKNLWGESVMPRNLTNKRKEELLKEVVNMKLKHPVLSEYMPFGNYISSAL